LRSGALLPGDPAKPPARSADPGDDYVIALPERERAVLVSGDQHLPTLADELPVMTARAFLDELAE
jgi:predicted nucleic acid-binding protein